MVEFRGIASICLLLAVPLWAQTPAAAPPTEPLVLRSTTRLVQVSVVVHDRKGQPVADLKKENFTITEKGKPQNLQFFSVESSKALPAAAAEKLGPGWHSNALAKREGAPNSVTVVLIDALNTKLSDQVYVREQVLKFLGTIQPQDRVAIYTLGTSLRVLHDFTNDSASLVARVKKYRAETTPENSVGPNPADDPTGDADLDEFLQNGFRIESDFRNVNRVITTCAALEAIAHHLEQVPGRKNLLWLSGSFPLQIGMDEMSLDHPNRERRTFTEEVERAVRALNQANLAIYPVDARGLVTPGVSATTRGNARAQPSPKLEPTVADQDTLIMLADRTGGRAFYNTNDLSKALQRALADSEVTYVLGYYPANENLDGKFREIKVKVDRGGLDVRFRKGYFALPEAPRTDKQLEGLIRDALWSPLEATGIALSGGNVAQNEKPGEFGVVVRVDPRSIRLEQQKDRWTGKLVLVFVTLDREYKQVTARQETISLNLTRERYDAAMKAGLTFLEHLPKQAAAQTVRVAVLDAVSGDVGSLRFPAP